MKFISSLLIAIHMFSYNPKLDTIYENRYHLSKDQIELLESFSDNKDTNSIKADVILGIYYRSKGKIDSSLHYLFKAYQLTDTSNYYAADIQRSLGISLLQSDSNLAFLLFNKSLSSALEINDSVNIVKSSICLRSWYNDHGVIDSSMFYSRNVIKYSSEKTGLASAYFNLAKDAEDRNILDSSIIYYDHALSYLEKDYSNELYTQSLLNKLLIEYRIEGISDEILDRFEILIGESETQIGKRILEEIYFNYYVVLKEAGNYEKALFYLNKSQQIKDVLNNSNESSNVELYIYDTEIKSLKALSEKQVAEIKSRNTLIYSILLISTIIILAFAIYLYLNTKYQRTQKELVLTTLKLQQIQKKQLSVRLRQQVVDILFTLKLLNQDSNSSSSEKNKLLEEAKNSSINLANSIYPSTLISDLGFISSLEELAEVLHDENSVRLSYYGNNLDDLKHTDQENLYWIINEICIPISQDDKCKEIKLLFSLNVNSIDLIVQSESHFDSTIKIESEPIEILIKLLKGKVKFSANCIKINLPYA